ncbi:hypothetical protein PUN28_019080 [Cardiocondyla obscurior]|uniref:Uncharacterized protein n=1 Tax=Cardiocondyla obscurior TaxID=286306 RepID=A0AAW2EEN8_9HYME
MPARHREHRDTANNLQLKSYEVTPRYGFFNTTFERLAASLPSFPANPSSPRLSRKERKGRGNGRRRRREKNDDRRRRRRRRRRSSTAGSAAKTSAACRREGSVIGNGEIADCSRRATALAIFDQTGVLYFYTRIIIQCM